jgi:hypothetical protein
LFGKAEGKKLLGRPVYKNHTKMYLKEMEKKVERCGLDLFASGWGPAVGCCELSDGLFQGLRHTELVERVNLW